MSLLNSESSSGTVPVVVAFLTDFGYGDGFAGCLHGVLYQLLEPSFFPWVKGVDLTHDIPAQQVHAGAWVLSARKNDFPSRTVFVCVVDPGVGVSSQRRLLAHDPVRDHYFIAPDNGLLSGVFADEENPPTVYQVENTQLFLSEVSQTFHGRDVYTPIAAHLVNALLGGTEARHLLFSTMGDLYTESVRFPVEQPVCMGKTWAGAIVYVDGYGNLMTNIPNAWADEVGDSLQLRVGDHRPDLKERCVPLVHSYEEGGRRCSVLESDFEPNLEKVFVLPGSGGTLEIAVYQQRADDVLNLGSIPVKLTVTKG